MHEREKHKCQSFVCDFCFSALLDLVNMHAWCIYNVQDIQHHKPQP